MTGPKGQLLSTKESAEKLGIHFQTMLKLCRDGKIPYAQPDGRSYKIWETDVETYMKSTEKNSSNTVVIEGFRCARIRCVDNPIKGCYMVCNQEGCLAKLWPPSWQAELKQQHVRVTVEVME